MCSLTIIKVYLEKSSMRARLCFMIRQTSDSFLVHDFETLPFFAAPMTQFTPDFAFAMAKLPTAISPQQNCFKSCMIIYLANKKPTYLNNFTCRNHP